MKNKTIEIRSENGQVFNTIIRPAVVADVVSGVIFKINEYEIMESYYSSVIKAYTDCGLHDIAKQILLIELPKDQDQIDKIFQISGYVKTFYDNLIKKEKVSSQCK